MGSVPRACIGRAFAGRAALQAEPILVLLRAALQCHAAVRYASCMHQNVDRLTASSSNSSPCPTWAINAWRDIARTAALCTTCTSHWPLFESLPPSSCGGRLAGREQAPPGGARDDASPTQCMQSPTLVHKNRPACRGSSRGAGWRPRRPACPGGTFFRGSVFGKQALLTRKGWGVERAPPAVVKYFRALRGAEGRE